MRAGIDAQPVADVLAALAANGDRYRRRIYTEQEVASCTSLMRLSLIL